MAERKGFVYSIDIAFPYKIPEQLAANLFDKYCDITIHDDFKMLCEENFTKHKRIDVLINNAGITYTKKADELYPREQWDRTLLVNLTAAFMCSQTVSVYMAKQREGSIINITRLNAELGFPDNPAYVASKGGLKMLGKALARDYGEYSIRVNNIGPGYIRTEMTKNSYSNKKSGWRVNLALRYEDGAHQMME